MKNIEHWKAENLRQYAHNNGEGLLFSYEKSAVDEILAELVELKAALTLIMRAAEGAKVNCGGDPESPDAIRNGALASIAAVAAQGLGLLKGPKLSEGI